MPFVKISAICDLVGMYLIEIPGPSLKTSNNQSKSILCVRETCLSCGLLPLIVIFRTGSLSSITMIFALSNGYLGNICMLHGPKTVEDSVLQEETAMVLVACLVIGTGCGSFLSYPIIQIL